MVVGTSVYALTTAHGFLGISDDLEIPAISLEAFPGPTAHGSVIAYKWDTEYDDNEDGDLGETTEDEAFCDEDCADGADWALIEFSNSLFSENTFLYSDELQKVRGHLGSAELKNGEVYVCGGYSGAQKGLLRGGVASVLMGQRFFRVKSISLQRELGE